MKEFGEIVSAKPSDKVILDVRGGGTAGVLPGAIVIASEALGSSLAEIPKDKEVIVHCNTGILAKIAHKTLSENGFKSRYLDAVIQVAADGSYEITEK